MNARKNCSADGCTSASLSKGLCKLRYQRQWRIGSTEVSRPCLHLPLEEKFWLYVDVKGDDECWLWTGFRDKDGYGKVRVGRSNIGAHRASYLLHFGEVGLGYVIRHRCNNSSCVNPGHLVSGTHGDNMLDRMLAGHYGTNEAASNWKFSNEVVTAVREAIGTYEHIGQAHGMSASQVGNIRRGDQRPAGTNSAKPSLLDTLDAEAEQEVAA